MRPLVPNGNFAQFFAKPQCGLDVLAMGRLLQACDACCKAPKQPALGARERQGFPADIEKVEHHRSGAKPPDVPDCLR
jgi:hypothetical protein